MSQFIIGNLFLAASVLAASISQVLIKYLINKGTWTPVNFALLEQLVKPEILYRGIIAVVLIVGGYLFWLASLTKLQLSYAYPIACSSVLPVALLSSWMLGERLTVQNWIGTILILTGVIFLTPTKS